MSAKIMIWASRQHVDHPTDKLVLLMMASECRDEGAICFSSTARLEEITGLDRKTIQKCRIRLSARELIVITDERRGRTGQIPVYRLMHQSAPKSAPLKEGETGQLSSGNDPGSGLVKTGKVTTFPSKAAHKRATETVFEPDHPSDDTARARGSDRRASPIHDDFRPSPIVGDLEAGLAHWSPEKLQTEFHRFADYHRAKGSKFVDWQAAWRNWLRNAITFERKSDASDRPQHLRQGSDLQNPMARAAAQFSTG